MPWDVMIACEFYKLKGWKAVPPHLLMAVQFAMNGFGCTSCATVSA